MFPEKFDPWMLIAVPAFYMIMAGYLIRDFIWTRWKSKS